MENAPKVALSASRIKVLQSCSWLYWSQYGLKLPRGTNEGASRGSTCHNIFEILINKRHIKHFDAIVKAKDIRASKAVHRLVEIYMKQLEIPKTSFDLVNEMIIIGLISDFFIDGHQIVGPEHRFEIINENPRYYIKGFIDLAGIKDDKIQIRDYKSSKNKFENDEFVSNVQALMYSLAAKKEWPKLKPFVRFVFLRFPEQPEQDVPPFSDETLNGFESYLEYVQTRVDNFTEIDAKADFASDKPQPTDGSFSGKLMCGFAKYKGQLKKDGNPMFACSYKFDFFYYVVKNTKGEIQNSIWEKDKDKIKLKEGETLERLYYSGCPSHRPKKSALDDF